MPDEVIDNAAVMKALTDVSTAVTSMRADIDALKKPQGRTEHDVIDRDRIKRKNAAAGTAQDVLDNARRASSAANATLERIRAARAERRPAASRVVPGLPAGRVQRVARARPQALPLDWFERGLNHLTAEPLTGEQLSARGKYADHFFALMRKGDQDAELRALAPQAGYMQTQDDAKGGFLVPDELERQIIRLSVLFSAMRGLVDVRTVLRSSLKQPVNLQGADAGWIGETEPRTETLTDDIGMLEWFAQTIFAQPKTTQELLDDADFDVEGWLNDGVARAIAIKEGDAWFNGDGVKKPRGILQYTVIADASWVWGKLGYYASGVAAALTDGTHNGVDILINMSAGLKREYLPNATWVMNRATAAVIRQIKDTTGQYIWQQPITAGQPSVLLGYPLETDDNAPSIGANTFPISFGDFQQAYRIIDRLGVTMMRDEITEKGFVKFYTRKRTGGGVKNFEALKLLKIATS